MSFDGLEHRWIGVGRDGQEGPLRIYKRWFWCIAIFCALSRRGGQEIQGQQLSPLYQSIQRS